MTLPEIKPSMSEVTADALHREAPQERRIERLERRLLELRTLNAAKSRFLTNVSHELRTPLTAIITYAEVLRDGLLGEVNSRQKEAVESVIGSGRELLSMIEEVLTYAKTNALAVEVNGAPIDLEEVVLAVRGLNAALLRDKRLGFETDFAPGATRVHADRDKLAHVLGNLVGNAVEFTPENGTVRIHASAAAGDPERIEVRVLDTGIGIDPKYHDMIFEEFAQVDSSRSRRHHGTGLGLAIARNFVRLHGGDLRVRSEPGRGSEFYFTLPRAECAEVS